MEWVPYEWELPGEALKAAKVMAQQDVPVVLIGEPGTGHEGVARFIHTHSPRASGPFIAVNCGALPDSLYEWTLVGQENGAADPYRPSKGLIGLAAGGVLLAYSIHRVGPRGSSVVLRLLRVGTYQPLGGQPRRADVRLL